MLYRSLSTFALVAMAALTLVVESANAQLGFTLTWGWQGDARQSAANSALTNIVNRYNAYGNFTGGNGNNVQAAYNPGVPTAQAGYGGWGGIIEYGGTWPNDRVTMHELNHWLGTGTYSNANGLSWNGPRAVSIFEQFEGVGARINQDGVHFWPYGLNFDSEWSEINAQRNVALLYALRADWGIGSTANPTAWAATNVSLVASDPVGTSGFNYGDTWSDGTFAHPNADYSTGNFDLRTPTGTPSWNFAGRSLTVNQGGRLLYNGSGSGSVVTIDDLIVDGGTVRHDQSTLAAFQLAGDVTLSGNATFDAAQGDIAVRGDVGGTGSLVKTGDHTLTLNGASSYAGSTSINEGTLRLGNTNPVAAYTFDSVLDTIVVNNGTGGAAMNGNLAGGAAIVPGGQNGNALSVAGGASVNINNPITNLDNGASWTVSAWVKTDTPGASILTKTNGGWSNGNTIFYLGDGTAGGSGGIPSGVRWAGGFFQGSTAATNVADDTWHQVTYVNAGGSTAIYVDGVAQPLSPGNSGFGNADVGSMVRLGVTTNTVAADGTVNFDGLLDDVQFFDQALSAEQVAALHQGSSLPGSLPAGTDVSIARGGTLDLNGVAQQIGSLSGSFGAQVELGGGALIVDSPENTLFRGPITGSGSFTKRGTGTLTLTAANSHTGSTQVDGGTLQLSGAGALGQSPTLHLNGGILDVTAVSSPFTLANGQVLSNDLSSTVLGNLAAGPGSTIDVGSETMTIEGDLSLQAGSTLSLDVGASGVGDKLDVVGQLNAGGTLEVLLDGAAPTLGIGDSFDLFDLGGASGSFAQYALPALDAGLLWNVAHLLTTGELSVVADVDLDGDGWITGKDFLLIQSTNPALVTQWELSYGAQVVAGGGPLSSSLAVPEPTSAAALAMVLLMAGGRRTGRLCGAGANGAI